MAELLAERLGPQLLLMRQEIAKLALLAAPSTRIARSHVEACALDVAEEPIWGLTDAIGEGRPRDALAILAPDLHRRPILIVTDFDGTIARIVMDPWGAQILPAAQRALRRLAGLPGVIVAILSGRVARDAASRARIPR